MIIMSGKALPLTYNNNLDERIEQHVTHPPKPEMTKTTRCEAMTDRENYETATHLAERNINESIGIQMRTDGRADYMLRVQCSMSDIESPTTVNKKSQDDSKKLQRTHDKLKNKNKELRKSVHCMDRCLSQEKNLLSIQKKRDNYLDSEHQRANIMKKQLQSDLETIQSINNQHLKENEMLQKSVQRKDQSLSHDIQTVSGLQKRLERLELELESRDAVNKQLFNDSQNIKTAYDNNERQKKQFEKSLNDMHQALSHEKKTVAELLKSLESMQNQVQTCQQNEAYFKAAYDGEVMKTENQKKQILDLQIQRQDLLNRLSKLAGDILTHENTSITDLSDANRPIKLSETYSELYDNEWTDAFEELTGRGETEILAVRNLLDMLLWSFRKCREVTWERYQSLKSTVSTIDIIHVIPSMRDINKPVQKTETTSTESVLSSHNTKYKNISISSEEQDKEVDYQGKCSLNASSEAEILYNRMKDGELIPQSNEEHLTCTTILTVDQEREIKRIWRTATTALMDEAVRHLNVLLLAKFYLSIEHWPNTSKYLARCIDLCWKMGVQEKPMHLDAYDETGEGSEKIFNQEKFRAYTKTGKRVAFVVWPALLMHEDGAMLVKGIAQGCQ